MVQPLSRPQHTGRGWHCQAHPRRPLPAPRQPLHFTPRLDLVLGQYSLELSMLPNPLRWRSPPVSPPLTPGAVLPETSGVSSARAATTPVSRPVALLRAAGAPAALARLSTASSGPATGHARPSRLVHASPVERARVMRSVRAPSPASASACTATTIGSRSGSKGRLARTATLLISAT